MKPKACPDQVESASLQNFIRFHDGRVRLVLQAELSGAQAEILSALELCCDERLARGNRQSGFVLQLDGYPTLFARRSCRGGLIRYINRDLFVGFIPRVFRELEVAIAARDRGIPVAEPMAAIVVWVAPGLYRSTMITRALPGKTLWQSLAEEADPSARLRVIDKARAAIFAMQEGGLLHADLNLYNLFVIDNCDKVVILDLDKARLYPEPLSPHLRARHVARLIRSARKLDPEAQVIDQELLVALTSIG